MAPYGDSRRNNERGRDSSYYNQNNQVSDLTPLSSFYEADGKTIKTELFNSDAKTFSHCFATIDDRGHADGISSTQMRRIFDEVKRFDRQISGKEEQWKTVEPYIRMINSKVSYTVARAVKKEPRKTKYYKNLEVFINSGIKLVKSAKDYQIFVSLFEAVYGFYYELAPKD